MSIVPFVVVAAGIVIPFFVLCALSEGWRVAAFILLFALGLTGYACGLAYLAASFK